MQLRRGAAIAAAAVAIALALLWSRHQREDTNQQARRPASAAARVAVSPSSNSSSVASARSPAASSARDRDPIGRAPDLRAVHDKLRASSDPAERRVARRAFGTCIPAFLPAAGQPVSVEPLVRALPANQRAEREAAWRDLFARCQRFGSEARDALMQENTDWRRDNDSADPGARAMVAARSGRLDDAAALVARISPDDPASVDSLSGIARVLARNRAADDRDLALRAAAVDTALPLVACDLGLACDAQSLRALALCAVEDVCQGDVEARILSRAGVDVAMADAAQRERARLVALIRANGKLALGDLLP